MKSIYSVLFTFLLSCSTPWDYYKKETNVTTLETVDDYDHYAQWTARKNYFDDAIWAHRRALVQLKMDDPREISLRVSLGENYLHAIRHDCERVALHSSETDRLLANARRYCTDAYANAILIPENEPTFRLTRVETERLCDHLFYLPYLRHGL